MRISDWSSDVCSSDLMACAGRAWCDYASFDPRMPPDLQLFIQRVGRDDQRIAALESAVVEFLGEIEATITALTGRKAEGLDTPNKIGSASCRERVCQDV